MYKTLVTILFVFSCVSFALAQDNYHKFEVSGGYSLEFTKYSFGSEYKITSTASTSGNSTTSNDMLQGFEASATYNFTKYIGAKFEFARPR